MAASSHRYTLIPFDTAEQRASFADEVRDGLTRPDKSIPYRFLYDEYGSKLFQEICTLPEYYPTRVERALLAEHAAEIATSFDRPITLVELGSGSAAKTRLLIEALLEAHDDLRYVPIDISPEILEQSALELLSDYRALEVRAIASEYEEGLRHLDADGEHPQLIAWLGSSVGNLSRAEAREFLGGAREALGTSDRMLVGIDLRKEKALLEAAYDDGAGVTARFSLNLLARLNRELGAEFELGGFRHRAVYHERDGRVEIALVSQQEQRVSIEALGLEVELAAGEAIHVEDAYKYSLDEIDALAGDAGLRAARRWLDPDQRFSLNLLAPR